MTSTGAVDGDANDVSTADPDGGADAPVLGKRGRPPGRAMGVLLGLATGSFAALLVVYRARRRAQDDLATAWQQSRLDASDTSLGVVNLFAVAMWVAVVATAAVYWRRGARRSSLLAVGGTITLVSYFVLFPGDLDDGRAATLTVLTWTATLVLAWAARVPVRPRSLVLVASVAALAGSVVGVAVPVQQNPLPSDEALIWWAAHDNGAIGLIDPLTDVGERLRAPVRDAEAVRASCRRFRTASQALASEPLAPVELRASVAEVSGGLVRVADRCIAEAGSIRVEDLLSSYQQVASTDAARQLDRLGT